MSSPPDLAAVARQAPFVFFGTVRRANASDVEMLDRDDEPSAVVRVDEVVSAPELVGDLTGRDVTVRLLSADVERGERHLFMATSLQFGESLAVAELARVPHDRKLQQGLRDEVIRAKLRALDDALADRLGLADLVVYGVVASVEPLETDTARAAQPKGEARVRWRVARLTVWRALKGEPPDAPGVVFPFPRTQKWSEMPLFLQGQEGVWILQRAETAELAGGRVSIPAAADGFAALDELDFHSPALVERIRLLLELATPVRRSRRR